MIRLANLSDKDRILEIIGIAREFMRANGNTTQWPDGYPSVEIVKKEILSRSFYVIESDGKIVGCFSFIIGEEPTYKVIRDGAWLNDNDYGTIHRVASDGTIKGVFDMIVEHCKSILPEIRIDTHKNNTIMRNLILKNGFTECGKIYIADGTERIAYHLDCKMTEDRE